LKIIIVGAAGRIGKEVDQALSDGNEIIRVGVRSDDFQCDYTDTESVKKMFVEVGEFDSLISVAGRDSTNHSKNSMMKIIGMVLNESFSVK
jgi:dTDP-4-dehydrorhamnose reductase